MTGAVVWFTGLPASGKTTLALAVRDRLPRPPVVLDSDELRAALGATGYTAAERDAFYASVGALAILFARQGHVVLVAATAPRRAYRDAVRTAVPRFVEVWVKTSPQECEARDVKGIYAQARAGAAPDVPGIGAAYEPPLRPDIVAEGGGDDTTADAIVAVL
jgi:adenylylsulfate kinase